MRSGGKAAVYGYLLGPLSRMEQAFLYLDALLILVYLRTALAWLGALAIAIFIAFVVFRWSAASALRPGPARRRGA